MHRIIASHMSAFKESYSLNLDESRLFEAFVAFSILSSITSEQVEPELLIYEGDDPGIDSILMFVDERHIATADELSEKFKSKRNDYDVLIVFVQTTTAETWDKKKINSFESAINDFISEETNQSMSDYLLERKRMFDNVIDNVGKVRGGKPAVRVYYACGVGKGSVPKEIEAAQKNINAQLERSELFSECSSILLDRDSIVNLYVASTGSYEAKFSIIGSASFPRSPGIEEGYVVTVAAKPFAKAVLCDTQGSLRRAVFEENVRDFIDFGKSPINGKMRDSVLNAVSTKRFGILNNGITIISPDVRLQSNEIFISNYQIVNGCQTSNVIFETLDHLGDETTLMVKLIETSDQDIVDEIVESTNSQNKIEDHQFLARLDCVKGIEKYFKVRVEDPDQALFFERRPNQYSNQNVPAIRIYSIKEMARCCGAMFFDRPDLSARYPGQLVEELSSQVFDSNNRDEIFYASAYSYYRLRLHISNQRIDPIFNSFKWHTLIGIKYFVCGKNIPNVTSSKIESVCAKIIDFMKRSDAATMKRWEELAIVMRGLRYSSRDDLRRTKMNADLKALLTDRPAPTTTTAA